MFKFFSNNQGMILISRIFISSIFIISGLSKIPGFEATSSYMANHGIPWVPLFLFPAIFVEVIAGLCVLLGFQTRIAGLVLFLYLIPVTMIFHPFWSEQGIERQVQMINFMKNMAILGGLAGIVATGAGIFSIDYKHTQKKYVTPEQRRDRMRAI